MVDNNMVVQGNVDGIFDQFVTGWFYPGEENGDCELQLLANGKEIVCIDANLDRPDVAANLGFGEKSGFSFNISGLSSDGAFDLSIVHKSSGFDFNGFKLNYCRDISDQFERLEEIFFPEYYRCQYGLEMLSNDEALQHYLKTGIFKDYNPCPWISCEYIKDHNAESIKDSELTTIYYLNNERKIDIQPSSIFNPKYYMEKYPDIANHLSLIGHYARYGHSEGRSGIDIRVPSHIREEMDEMVELEPMIRTSIPKLDAIVRYPQLTGSTYFPRLMKNRFGDSIKAVVCVPFISRGGADLVSTYVLRAYQKAFGVENVLLLVTDASIMEVPDWIDPESNVVFFDQETKFNNSEERINALHDMIGLLSPEKVFNVNSHTAWKMYSIYGAQLASVVDLYAFVFCFDFDNQGNRVGYITDYLPKTIKYLSAVFCDNQKIIDDIKSTYGFGNADISVLHTTYIPVLEKPEQLDFTHNKSADKFLWIGRLARQKRPEILIEIAKSMPAEQFVVYGAVGNSAFSDDIVKGKYPNIEYRAVYNHASEIDYTEFKAFLNTSEWEGIPTIIIQMMGMGMPLLSSVVGGIGELLDNETGWPVSDWSDTQAYIDQIRRMSIRTDEVIAKADAGYKKVHEQHSWTAFYNKLEFVDAFANNKETERRNVVLLDRRRA